MKKNNTTAYFLLSAILILFAVTGCEEDSPSSADPDRLPLSFQEEFAIGADDEEVPDEALLGSPISVKTDGAGNIYIADSQLAVIKVFNNEGNYLRTVGQAGSGPGDFGSEPAFELDSEDNLIAFNRSAQLISWFSEDGELLKTASPEMDQMVWSSQIRQLAGNGYATLRKLLEPEEENESLAYHSNVLHFFDESFENRTASAGPLDSLMDTGSQFVEYYARFFKAGTFWPEENGGLWFAPVMYDGILFRFDETESGWKPVEEIQGYTIPEEPVTYSEEADPDKPGQIVFTVYTGDGPFVGMVNSASLGVFRLNDGRLLHISSQLVEEERQTMVEVFTREGKLEGIGRLEAFTYPVTVQNALIESIWKDQNGRFYFIDNREVPVVRVGQIEGI